MFHHHHMREYVGTFSLLHRTGKSKSKELFELLYIPDATA